jgi:hypothetical protein
LRVAGSDGEKRGQQHCRKTDCSFHVSSPLFASPKHPAR